MQRTSQGRKGYWILILAVCAALFAIMGMRADAAGPVDLSQISTYSQLIFTDVTLSNSALQGTAAYGGNAMLTDVNVANSLFANCDVNRNALSVEGDLTYTNGTVHGGRTLVGGTQTINGVNFPCAGVTAGSSGLNFATIKSDLQMLSSNLAEVPAVKQDKKEDEDCQLRVTAKNSDLNIIDIDANDLNNLDTGKFCDLGIQAPCSATVIVNVDGWNVNFTNLSTNLTGGVAAQQVVFNFFNANTILLNNSNLNGTVIAPNAAVTAQSHTATNSYINGSLAANSIMGSINMNLVPFTGMPQAGCEKEYDFGDLPNQYPTLLLYNGARHEISNLLLGTKVDAEADGQPSASADADDASNADEDGVVTNVATWSEGVNGGNVSVTASMMGCLNGWIDWERDFTFVGSADHIIVNQKVNAGAQNITFDVPVGGLADIRAARYRISPLDSNGMCADTIEPTGLIVGGEVEDYVYIFSQQTAVSLSSFEVNQTQHTQIIFAAVALLTLGTGLAIMSFKRD